MARLRITGASGVLFAGLVLLTLAGSAGAQPFGGAVDEHLSLDLTRTLHVTQFSFKREGLGFQIRSGYVIPMVFERELTGFIALGDITVDWTPVLHKVASREAESRLELPDNAHAVYMRLPGTEAREFFDGASRSAGGESTDLSSLDSLVALRVLWECQSDSFWDPGEDSVGTPMPVPAGSGRVDILVSESQRYSLTWNPDEARVFDYFAKDLATQSVLLRRRSESQSVDDLESLDVTLGFRPEESYVHSEVRYRIRNESASSILTLPIHPVLRVLSVRNENGRPLDFEQRELPPGWQLGDASLPEVSIFAREPTREWNLTVEAKARLPRYSFLTGKGVHNLYFIEPQEIRLNLLWWYLGRDRNNSVNLAMEVEVPEGFVALPAYTKNKAVRFEVTAGDLKLESTSLTSSDLTIVLSKRSVSTKRFELFSGKQAEIRLVHFGSSEEASVMKVLNDAQDAVGYLERTLQSSYPTEEILLLQDFDDYQPWSSPYLGVIEVSMSTLSPDFSEERLKGGLAHELAHSWFGHLKEEKRTHDYWINEAIPSYLGDLYTDTWNSRQQIRSSSLYLGNAYFYPGLVPISFDRANSPSLGVGILAMVELELGREGTLSLIRELLQSSDRCVDTDEFLDLLKTRISPLLLQKVKWYLSTNVLPSFSFSWSVKTSPSGLDELVIAPSTSNFGPIQGEVALSVSGLKGEAKSVRLKLPAQEDSISLPVAFRPVKVSYDIYSAEFLMLSPDAQIAAINRNAGPGFRKLRQLHDPFGAVVHLERLVARRDRVQILVSLARAHLLAGNTGTAYEIFSSIDPSEVPSYSKDEYDKLAKAFEKQASTERWIQPNAA